MQVQDDLSLHSWIKQVFERNHLSEANEQPLYQYQLTEAEYIQLKSLLRLHSNKSGIRQKDSVWCAAFCIFCAEWFRRDYQGGWSWKTIWQELNFEVEANVRSYVLNKGLREFWKRPLSQYSDERHSYLGSVFREGGLSRGRLSDYCR